MTPAPFTEQAQAICDRHWHQPKRCAGCPIMPACHSGTPGRLTEQALADWRARVNKAAGEVQG